MAIQQRNASLVDLLKADFQPRNEMAFAWANACSMYQQLPGLRGFWPMSAVDSSGNAQDQSGHGHVLTYAGNPVYGLDLTTARRLASYIRFDGTGDYLTRADEADLDITGTETYISNQATGDGAGRGITMGGWWRPEDAVNFQMLISKWVNAGQYSYYLALQGTEAGDPVRFFMSDDGTNSSYASSVTPYSTSLWQFFAGRFCDSDTGEELAVWVNDEKTTNATARNSIRSGTDNFAVGGNAAGAYPYTGRACLVWLCAAALPDVTIWALYQQTRALFGV
jgi:hypothetical protein